jgi:hypothetical protein
MGKHKRTKKKKSQISFINSPLALIESKEKFIENLIHIFSSYSQAFKTFIQGKVHSKTSVVLTNLHLSLKDQKCELFYQKDESREFHHIFYYHLQKFLNNLTSTLAELDDLNHKLIIPAINDALVLLEVVQTDIERISGFLFEPTGINCKEMILIIFHEHLVKEKWVQRILQEDHLKDEDFLSFIEKNLVYDGFTVKTGKKRRRKSKKVEGLDEMDEEILLFEQRIMKEQNSETKTRPNVSNEWIKTLRRTLKNRYFN